jgi:hypothetical protein
MSFLPLGDPPVRTSPQIGLYLLVPRGETDRMEIRLEADGCGTLLKLEERSRAGADWWLEAGAGCESALIRTQDGSGGCQGVTMEHRTARSPSLAQVSQRDNERAKRTDALDASSPRRTQRSVDFSHAAMVGSGRCWVMAHRLLASDRGPKRFSTTSVTTR